MWSVRVLVCAVVVIVSSGRTGVAATEYIQLVTPEDTIDTVISEVILREAYGRIGIGVDIVKVPAERALIMADRGNVDGEVQRIDGINKKYTNLVQVYPSINFIEAAVFSSEASFRVDGWESLRPYTIGLVRGIKFAENNTADMDVYPAPDYEHLIAMLIGERVDIFVSPGVNGLYHISRLGVEGINRLEPSVMRFDLFHYIHKSRQGLIEKITPVLESMAASGELARIRNHVVSTLIEQASRGQSVCDDTYACFSPYGQAVN
jgi:polar amino acid transport system substrate-binding protein